MRLTTGTEGKGTGYCEPVTKPISTVSFLGKDLAGVDVGGEGYRAVGRERVGGIARRLVGRNSAGRVVTIEVEAFKPVGDP